MLEKFEREHKERLERQQKQYEEHLRRLEENMKRRCDEYLTSNRFESADRFLFWFFSSFSFPSTKNEDFLHDESNSLRQFDKDLINQFYPSNANLSRTASRTNLPRSQSREDLSRFEFNQTQRVDNFTESNNLSRTVFCRLERKEVLRANRSTTDDRSIFIFLLLPSRSGEKNRIFIIFSVRLELSAKHAKHISDLKSYYEHEIEELTDQLNRNRMG